MVSRLPGPSPKLKLRKIKHLTRHRGFQYIWSDQGGQVGSNQRLGDSISYFNLETANAFLELS